jgi:polysaccharide pyruvyl transferase WcaK-like protein
MARQRVLLISRLVTQNAGNEALSKELIRYVTESLPHAEVRALDRYPRYFEQFGLAKLGSDLVPAFDALAEELIRKFPQGGAPLPDRPRTSPRPGAGAEGPATAAMVRLDETARELSGPLKRLKRSLGVRRRLAAAGLIERDATSIAIAACATSDLVIWNPAGEVRPTPTSADHVVRLLLLLRIAQLSGRKTAVINHSLELGDDRLQRLVAHVYSKFDYVGIRDAQSLAVATSVGLSAERIHESPDLVFLASRQPRGLGGRDPNGPIGLAINGLESLAGSDEWKPFMEGLKHFGRPLLLVSNAMNHDLEFSRHLAELAGGGHVVTHQPNYEALRGYYRKCSVLVSSRLHASILALCEGVPVVTIEPSVFKLTAIFDQMGYPLKTDRLQHAGWSKRLLERVAFCLTGEGTSLSAATPKILERQVARIDAAYEPLFAIAGEVPAPKPAAIETERASI